jgi:RNA polymerase sigma-70 factor (ECF subfamily)
VTRAEEALDDLADGIRQRSEEAFSAVYALTADGLASYAYGMLRDRPAAEDAVQHAFLELTRAAPSLRGGSRSLRAWLYRSVRYTCLDEIRRRGRRPEVVTDAVPDTGYTDDLDLPDPVLQEALLSLSERQRSLLVLRHVVGLPAADVARVMSTNRSAVYAATAHAERRLRQLLSVESEDRPASVSIEDMGK